MKLPVLAVRLDQALPCPRIFVPVPVPDVDSDQIASISCIETDHLQSELLFIENDSGTGTGTGTRENLASCPLSQGFLMPPALPEESHKCSRATRHQYNAIERQIHVAGY